MLHYGNFKFDSKEDFINYIEKKMEHYWENHNNSFSRVCEGLDSYDGFLDNDRVYSMDELDESLEGYKPSEIIRMVNSDFNYSDNYFYYDGYGYISSTNEKEYYNSFNYSDVFKKLADDYSCVFSRNYGHAYCELFDDISCISSWEEEETQDYINEGYYDYLFEDDDNFFSDDDLDN